MSTYPTQLNDDGGLENLMNNEKFNLFPTASDQSPSEPQPAINLLPNFNESKVIENLGVIMRYSASEYKRLREGKGPDQKPNEAETAWAVIHELVREIITGKYS
jgi:hypothetical protein